MVVVLFALSLFVIVAYIYLFDNDLFYAILGGWTRWSNLACFLYVVFPVFLSLYYLLACISSLRAFSMMFCAVLRSFSFLAEVGVSFLLEVLPFWKDFCMDYWVHCMMGCELIGSVCDCCTVQEVAITSHGKWARKSSG